MYTITYSDNDKVLMTTANSDSLIAHAIKHLLDGRAIDHGEISVFNTENHDLVGVLKAETAVDNVTQMCEHYRKNMESFNSTFFEDLFND
jgi:hypothetical protein